MTDPITTTEAGKILGVTRHRINHLIRAGRLPAVRLGTIYVIERSAVEAYKPLPQGWRKGRKRGPKGRAKE